MSVMVDLLDSQWGQQLLSDYHVVKCVHISPMSEVFALESADGRTRLILKAMKPGIISHQMLETLKTSTLEGVVPIRDYHITESYAYVIKPYIEGVSLQDSIVNGLSIDTLLNLMKQLVKIVSNCHSQSTPIILRDIKPDNLMICHGQLQLFDMESSKLKASTTSSRDTVLLGTPGYAAPEQYGFQNSDERTDIYAIGQVMNSLLDHVVTTKSHGSIGIILQRVLFRSARRIAKRATSFDPALRFQSSQTFKKTLEEIYPRIYVSSMTVFVMILALLFVGFRLPGVDANDKAQSQVQSESEIKNEDEVVNQIQGSTSSENMVVTSTGVITQDATTADAETLTEPVTEPMTEPLTEPLTESSTQLTTQPTSMLAKLATTKQAPTLTATKATADSQDMVEVQFTGKLVYASEVPKCNFLIIMEGVTDPSFKKQFGNPVTFNKGSAQYADSNKSKLVSGDLYNITGYLDLNGNFGRDYQEPTEFISKWTFNGNQSQTIDFINMVYDQEFDQKGNQITNQGTINPGESDFTKFMKSKFKVAQYGGSKEDFETLLSTFGVSGNGTGIQRITNDYLKDIKLVVMSNSRNEPISDYVQTALNAMGFSGGSGMSLGWFENRFWIYINANSSEEFKALIDKDRIMKAIGQK